MDFVKLVSIHLQLFLVFGGSGGAGHFIVQIFQIREAKQVITSASKDDGLQILKDQYTIKDAINRTKKMLLIIYSNSLKIRMLILFMTLLISNQVLNKQQNSSRKWFVRVNTAHYWLGLEQTQLKTFVPIH
jgi:hypothetical protein